MSILSTVQDYYPKVDAGEVDWVLRLFAEDGIYQRADACYEGIREITDFYENARKITGKHAVEEIFAQGHEVVVNGVFEGFGADGAAKKIAFADFWTFNEQGLVALRKTFLAIGADYVKD